jgi:subtilisin family serine protease
VLGACDSTPPELSEPARIVATSGGGQAVVNAPAAAAAPLVVTVFDVMDRPVRGVAVQWSQSDPTGTLSATTTTTDSAGTARVTWTLGQGAGVQFATATSAQIPGASAVFAGTNTVMSIAGAVSVSPALPLAFAFAGAMPSDVQPAAALPAGGYVYRASAVRAALAAGRAPVRRLIVELTDGAAGVAGGVAIAPAAIERSRAAMAAALAPALARGLVTAVEASPVILASRVTVPEGVSVAAAANALRATPGVESVTLDEIVPMLDDYTVLPVPADEKPFVDALAGTLPNEPFLAQSLWHYNMIDAPRAWATQTGSENVVVAVVDTGIRFDHTALASCTGFQTCSAGNLTTDGYNFVAAGNRLANPQPLCPTSGGGTTMLTEVGPGPDPTQPNDFGLAGTCWSKTTAGSHGSHVSGTIGARGNDGVGTSGVNWNVKIRPVRVLDITGSGSFFDISQGILYAAGLPASGAGGTTVTAPSRASVINMSLGGGGTSAVLLAAVTAATTAGSLIVASAGNSQSSGAFVPSSYPAVLAVSAMGPDLQISSYTNIGPNVSLSAPGGNFRSSGSSGVVSTTWDFFAGTPTYAYYQGTSMAAPHVTGVAALVLAANPGMTNTQLRERLQNTAVHLGSPGRDDRYGYGLVNAFNAVNNVTNRPRATYVHVLNAATGDTIRRLTPGADGSFTAARVPPGSYWVVAGQDESGDGRIGVPGRRFGWFGGPTGPATVTLASGASAAVAILAGTPTEAKPNATQATANRIVVNGYVLGQINATYREAWFSVQIPRAESYTFETNGVIGSCGYGIELDTAIDVLDANGTVLATNDDATFPGSRFCSRIVRTMTPGAYLVRVRPGPATANGQYTLQVRDYP